MTPPGSSQALSHPPTGMTIGIDPANEGHGTAMASAALGARFGVAKKSKLTIVRASRKRHNDLDVGIERWIDSLAQVYDAIKNNQEQGKAVLSMSWGFDPPKNPGQYSCLLAV